MKTSNIIALLLLLLPHHHAFQIHFLNSPLKPPPRPIDTSIEANKNGNYDGEEKPSVISRRKLLGAATKPALILSTSIVAPFIIAPQQASAGIDPSLLKTLPVDGDTSGTATRLRQIEAQKDRPEDRLDIPYTSLPSGVSYREYREGRGDATVVEGSRVGVEMTIRCKSFSTANEPGGLKYFSTRDDTEFNELAWIVGSGEMVPGLEEGMMGMKKGALRRVEVPSTLVFAARKANQLPLPKEGNKDGKRRFENLFKTDATLLFEILVTRIK